MSNNQFSSSFIRNKQEANAFNNSTNKGDIQYFSTNSGNHLFYSSGATQREIMRIDSNGNVGIGIDIPVYKLDVAGLTRVVGGIDTDICFGTPSDTYKLFSILSVIMWPSSLLIKLDIILLI